MAKFSKIAIAAAITGALVLPASAAFAGDRKDKQTERAIVGALIGGIAGAALSDGDKGTIAIAALAGAAIGASTGKDNRDPRYAHSYDNGRYNTGYANNGYGANGYSANDNRYAQDRSRDRQERRDRRDRRQDSRYDYYGPRR